MKFLLKYHISWGMVGWHVLAWSIYVAFNYSVNKVYLIDYGFLDNLLLSFILIAAFYWLVKVLLLISSKKYRILGAGLLIVTFIVLRYIAYFLIYKTLPSVGVLLFKEDVAFDNREFLQNYILVLFRIFTYSFLYFLLLRNMDLSRKKEKALQEKLAITEERNYYRSKFLTAQIFPHFVKNSFQGIVSDALRRGDEKTANTILTVSELMDYINMEVNDMNDLIYVKKELKYLDKFISMVRNQQENPAVVEYSTVGAFSGEKIPPLTLLTFIENVYKYGIINAEHPLQVQTVFDEHGFVFSCRNRKKKGLEGVHSTKIGLENIKQRLEMHLPNLYELKVEEDDFYFEIVLTLKKI